jgi:iron(III) transport system substrate-binding protein
MGLHAVRLSLATLALVTVCAGVASGQPTSADSQDWQKVLRTTLEAAKKEGAITIAGPPQGAERSVLLTFQKAYPDIRMQYIGLVNSSFISRTITERNGGIYTWDVFIGGVSSGYKYIEDGYFQPVRDFIIDPSLVKDETWRGGFEAGFRDNAKAYMYGFTQYVTDLIKINRDAIPADALNSASALLDPKWKGKIVMYDPRAGGAGTLAVTMLRKQLGDSAIKTLLVDQQPVLSTDKRQFTEWVVRGRYPIGIGVVDPYLAPFREQGLQFNVGSLETTVKLVTTGSGNLYIIGKAPHPNATKIFVNWLLSKETQELWAKTADTNSRRTDVAPAAPESMPDDDKISSYVDFNAETGNDYMQDTQALARNLIQ